MTVHDISFDHFDTVYLQVIFLRHWIWLLINVSIARTSVINGISDLTEVLAIDKL
jgi:hypothetical protein